VFPSRSSQKAIEKILTLPLEFYDENNPGRIADELLGFENHTWTLPRNRRAADSQALSGAGHFVIICLSSGASPYYFWFLFLSSALALKV